MSSDSIPPRLAAVFCAACVTWGSAFAGNPVPAAALVWVQTSHDDPAPAQVGTPQAPPQAAPQAAPQAPPQASSTPRSPFGDHVLAISPDRLHELRGGFTNGEGLRISFGIERAIYINGRLETTTSLNLSVAAGRASANLAQPGHLALIRNGPGNTFRPGTISGNSIATVIQNTLNNQNIRSVTTIEASVNSLQLLRGLNLQSTLRGAVIDSLRR